KPARRPQSDGYTGSKGSQQRWQGRPQAPRPANLQRHSDKCPGPRDSRQAVFQERPIPAPAFADQPPSPTGVAYQNGCARPAPEFPPAGAASPPGSRAPPIPGSSNWYAKGRAQKAFRPDAIPL